MSSPSPVSTVCDAQTPAGAALIVAGVVSLALAVALVYVGAVGVQEATQLGVRDARRAAAPTLMRTSGRGVEPPMAWASGVAVLTIVVGVVSLFAYLLGGLMVRYAFFGVLLALAMLVVGSVALNQYQSASTSRSGWLQAASGLWIAFVLLQFGAVGLGMTVVGAQMVGRCRSVMSNVL